MIVAFEGQPGWDQIIQAIKEVGFPIVITLLLLVVIVTPLLALLRYVIKDAVAHFNQRLDQSSTELSAGFRDLSGAIRHLDGTLDKQANMLAANHEALSNVMLFISHTQQEVVAHRTAVEGQNIVAPSPPMTTKKEEAHE